MEQPSVASGVLILDSDQPPLLSPIARRI